MRTDNRLDGDRAAHLFEIGMSPKLIARRLGSTTATVSRYLKRRFGTIVPTKPYCAELVLPPELAGSRGYKSNAKFIEHFNEPGSPS
ncbi:MAG: hypothetical protein ACLGXA_08030 [Acidobacteriota bacterium]